ncbi:nucleotide sugar dehydrogenase [Parasediminibacterium sp. JCM 36343]|uniref:nucleotide sugar dehydrogenase n=1 Tax=Parasediminibacterium sp. JCM 36343 TaxID=3374279 RepID=UPI00397BEE9B
MKNTEVKIAIIGLGYVGLPIALSFARKLPVIGFDINEKRVALMQQGIDPSHELTNSDFGGCDIVFTSSIQILKEANFYIIAVPTAVDAHNIPDLTALKRASSTIGAVLKQGDYVIFESTVYPGCTEEDCLPIIEEISGLKVGVNFKLGYSPERINPGDKEHTLENIIKVVAGCDEEALETIVGVYSLVVKAGIHKAPSIKVAEAAKIIENTQRDLNIALMNELSIIFDKMGINTYDVLAAAATKWNFLRFQPGLVGGHCIGVDPYYLTYKAAKLGYASKIIAAGRYINDSMGGYVAKKIIQHIIRHSAHVKEAKVLVMGATFKENVTDIRNSKVADVVHALKDYHLNVEVADPYADSNALMEEYNFPLADKIATDYDAVVIIVPHKSYKLLDDTYFASITKPNGLIADIKGIYQNKITSRQYWSL